MIYTTNTLVALKNILDRNSCRLTPIYRSNGSVNAAGDSLEFFIKDMFCTGASAYQFEEEKNIIYNQFLSWKGNSTNFPDFIIKNGPGVEPKKMNGIGAPNLALNSSFPKAYIHPESQNLPPLGSIIEENEWQEKNIIYAVGNLNRNDEKLNRLWLAYGNTFIANENVYTDLTNNLKNTIEQLPSSEFAESKELGRILKLDPLKITNLRLRGMWELTNPEVVFQSHLTLNEIPVNATKINLIILETDYNSLDLHPDFTQYIENGKLVINRVLITNPNDVETTLNAYLFEGYTD